MVAIEKVDTRNKTHIRRFVQMPFSLYASTPQWVPPLRVDVAGAMNKDKYPFYEHSDADFFLARQDGHDVGRIAVIEHKRYNQYHNYKRSQFYFFECIDDLEVAQALFDRVYEWAHQRGLTMLIGPKGMGALDGYGMLTDGFQHRQMMTMMNYNLPYLPALMEKMGFEKEVDFISCYINTRDFVIPDRVHSIAERIEKRGTLVVNRFENKSDLKKWATRIGKAYNQAFVNNWEYAPLTDREIEMVLDSILMIADPRLIKIITHNDDAVGFLFGFRDISVALQQSGGKLLPFGMLRILRDLRNSPWIALNGAGILPEYQGHGGNALLYAEMQKTVNEYAFTDAECCTIADTATNMRADLVNLGAVPYKNHRVFRKAI